MTMTTLTPPSRLRSLVAGCAVVLGLLCRAARRCTRSPSPCMVNGEPITNYDIEQRTKLNFLTTHKQLPRQEVIDELINEKVKIKEAKKYGVDPDFERYRPVLCADGSRMRITPEQLTKSLESQGIRPDTLKARIKADMVWSSLVRGRYKESLQVGEKDVNDAVKARRRTDPEPTHSNTRCSRSC